MITETLVSTLKKTPDVPTQWIISLNVSDHDEMKLFPKAVNYESSLLLPDSVGR